MTSARHHAGPSRAGLAAGLAAVAALGALAVWLQMVRERHVPEVRAEQMLYVTSPGVVTRLALSYRSLAADLYWMRTLQYYGGLRLEGGDAPRYDLLYPMLELTTALDPAFSIAYRFGAFFLAEPQPGGAGRPDLAVRLLEKGRAANPHRWEYPYDIGFVHYRIGDFVRAAEWFRRAEEVPASPNWLGPLAAVTLARGGDVATSRIVWQQILDSSEESWIRRAADLRLQQLDAIEAIAWLDTVTAAYERRHGDPPETWQDVIRAGLLQEVPQDPAGHPYELNPWWGDASLSRESPLWPLPMDAPR